MHTLFQTQENEEDGAWHYIILMPMSHHTMRMYNTRFNQFQIHGNKKDGTIIVLSYLTPPSLCPGLLVLQILHFVLLAQLMLPHLRNMSSVA